MAFLDGVIDLAAALVDVPRPLPPPVPGTIPAKSPADISAY